MIYSFESYKKLNPDLTLSSAYTDNKNRQLELSSILYLCWES